MRAVVLDTHAALWWSFLPTKLSPAAADALSEADELLFPSIVFWETSLLVRKGRIELPIGLKEWLRGLRSTTRVKIAALTAENALRADSLSMHDDPADRFIVATALGKGLPVVTKDAAIRKAKVIATIW